MSIRRTQQTVERLWKAMEAQSHPQTLQAPGRSNGSAHPNPRHGQRARASPPPTRTDPELGYNYNDTPPPQFTAEAMQPPRLQSASCCSKLVISAVCCGCLILSIIVIMVLWNLPLVVETRAAVHSSLLPQPVPAPEPVRRRLPAILQRYGMIRRATAPARGVDAAALNLAFPGWRRKDGGLEVETAIGDLALGLAAVVDQLSPSSKPEVAIDRLPRPQLSEPPSPVVESEEESEL